MMSSAGMHAPSLKAFENKSNRNRVACPRTFQHVGSISVNLFLRVP